MQLQASGFGGSRVVRVTVAISLTLVTVAAMAALAAHADAGLRGGTSSMAMQRDSADSATPWIEILTPAPGQTAEGMTLVMGRASDSLRVDVRAGENPFIPADMDDAGNWTLTVDFSTVPRGASSITAKATNSTGSREVSVPLTITGQPALEPGSLPKPLVGPGASPHALPSSYVSVSPGQNLQAVVNSHPAGTAFVLKAGVHRGQSVVPRTGDRFIGERGAVLNGSRLLTGFIREGSYWVASGQTGAGRDTVPVCLAGWDCNNRDELFVDNRMLQQVTRLADVGPGKWFFDYATGKVYFADDPAGKTVELAATGLAIYGGEAYNVVIRGLVVEKYATPVHWGPVGLGGYNWTIEYNEFRLNHAAGVQTGYAGPGHTIRHNYIHRNGQAGLLGQGSNGLIENNEIAYNNIGGFNWLWEGGGTKFVATIDLVVRGNYSHNNRGPGMWTDIDNRGTLYENNLLEDNEGPGIFHEISYNAVIRGNHAYRNGFSPWPDIGAGILVLSSTGVEVTANTVKGNRHGILGISDDRGAKTPLINLWVHHNTIEMATGYSGVVLWPGGPGPFASSANNRFDYNTYRLSGGYHRWNGLNLDAAGWRSYGHDDPNGTWK